jgi:hypothetical protein
MLLANKENIVNFWEYNGDLSNVDIDFTSIKIYTDYIFLDSTERAKFADNQHEYLIEQLQYDTYTQNKNISSSTYSIPLTFKHPVKEIFFCGKPYDKPDVLFKLNDSYDPYDPYDVPGYYPELTNLVKNYDNNIIHHGISTYNSLINNPTNQLDLIETTRIKLTLQFNQLPRFSPRNLKYFTRQQIYEYHNGGPSFDSNDGLGCYSFALQPGEYQPSGTCNFSRIDNPRLVFTDIDYLNGEYMNDIYLFAINYNVLRIGSGMGSLVFSS